jgi:hypothetical protein
MFNEVTTTEFIFFKKKLGIATQAYIYREKSVMLVEHEIGNTSECTRKETRVLWRALVLVVWNLSFVTTIFFHHPCSDLQSRGLSKANTA